MEEYVWISKMAHHPVFVSHAHPILRRVAEQYKVNVTLAGPDDLNLEAYLQAFRDAVERRVAGIMIIGWQDAAITPLINDAVDRGIPVVTVDSDVPGSKRLAHVGTDWWRMGAAMADKLADLTKRRGEVLMIGMLGMANMEAGFRGFKERMTAYPEITVLGPENDMDVWYDKAESIVTRFLSTRPNLTGIAGFDSNSGPGAALALEKAGKERAVKLVCVDADRPQTQHIFTGAINVAFCQKREAFTFLAFQMLHAYNHGSAATAYRPGMINIPGNIDTGHLVVTAENSTTFERELQLDEALEYHRVSQQFELFSRMIESTPGILLATDAAQQIIYANPAGMRALGYTDEEISALPLARVLQLSEVLREAVSQCLHLKSSTSFETMAIRKDGSTFPIQVNVSLLMTDTSARGLVVIAMDLTQRKRFESTMRESEEKFRLLSEQSLVGLLILQDGQVKYANLACADLLGYSVDEMKAWEHQGYARVIHPEDRAFVLEQGRRKQIGDPNVETHYSYRVVTRAGETKWVDQYSKTIMYEGRPADFVAAMDITRFKRNDGSSPVTQSPSDTSD